MRLLHICRFMLSADIIITYTANFGRSLYWFFNHYDHIRLDIYLGDKFVVLYLI